MTGVLYKLQKLILKNIQLFSYVRYYGIFFKVIIAQSLSKTACHIQQSYD